MNKRIISGAAALAMVISGAGALPTGTFAGASFDIFASAETIASGYCGREDENEGKNVTWALDSEGTLTIGGTGAMADYSVSGYAPWVGKKITKVIIGQGVENIGALAFISCYDLKNIEIPNSIKKIGAAAFAYCTVLDNINIPNGVTEIEYQAFGSCKKLESIIIPDTVTCIGDYTFMDCEKLSRISLSKSLTDIGSYAFKNCSGLESIIIPDTVVDISINAFENCTNLKSVILSKNLINIQIDTFKNCTALTDIEIPDSIEIIESGAFYGCSSLKSIYIPSNVYSIQNNAFNGCTNLEELILPPRKENCFIGEKAFFQCPNLKSATIPAEAYIVDYYAFGYLNDNLEKTENFMLYCYPDSVGDQYAKNNEFYYIGTTSDGLHKYCTTKVLTSGTCGKADVNDSKNVTWSLSDDGTLTISGTGAMGDFAYNTVPWADSRENIKKVVICEGVTTVGESAFMDCTALTSVTLPDSLESIGKMSFAACIELSEINFPDGLKSIGDFAFISCFKLKSVSVPKIVENIGEKALGYYHDIEHGGEYGVDGFTISGYKGTAAEKYATSNGFTFVPLVIPGDVTDDGKVDGEDLARLQQFVAGWNVTVETDTGDVTGDGKVNGEDIALVQKYLAGWSVTLGRADA